MLDRCKDFKLKLGETAISDANTEKSSCLHDDREEEPLKEGSPGPCDLKVQKPLGTQGGWFPSKQEVPQKKQLPIQLEREAGLSLPDDVSSSAVIFHHK